MAIGTRMLGVRARVLIVTADDAVATRVAYGLMRDDGIGIVRRYDRADVPHHLLTGRNDEIPHVVVCTLDLPGSDGFEVAVELWDRYPAVRAVLLVDQVSPSLKALAVAAGAHGLLPVTAAEDTLRAAVRQAFLEAEAHAKGWLRRPSRPHHLTDKAGRAGPFDGNEGAP